MKAWSRAEHHLLEPPRGWGAVRVLAAAVLALLVSGCTGPLLGPLLGAPPREDPLTGECRPRGAPGGVEARVRLVANDTGAPMAGPCVLAFGASSEVEGQRFGDHADRAGTAVLGLPAGEWDFHAASRADAGCLWVANRRAAVPAPGPFEVELRADLLCGAPGNGTAPRLK